MEPPVAIHKAVVNLGGGRGLGVGVVVLMVSPWTLSLLAAFTSENFDSFYVAV